MLKLRKRGGRTKRKRCRRPSCVRAIVCTRDQDMIRLKSWMKGNYFDNTCSLIPAKFPDTGRGLMTKKCIQPGEKIVSIPGKLLITPAVVLNSDIGHHIKRWIPKLTFHQALTVFLLWERQKQDSSVWCHYIRTLPTKYTTLAYFTDTELSLLPKILQNKAREQREKLTNAYTDVMNYCVKHWQTFTTFIKYEDFLWAWCSVNTRAVYYKSDLWEFYKNDDNHIAMAPYLDLLNHSCTAKIHAGYNQENGCYEITTEDKYKKYQQVFISYGSHDNYFLLMEYGFIIPGNPHDSFVFDFDDVIAAAKHFSVQHLQQKEDILTANDLKSKLGCTMEGLSWMLQTAVRLLAMDWNEMKESVWKRSMIEGCPISERNEALATNIAKHLIQQAIHANTQAVGQFPRVPVSEMTCHQQLAYGMYDIERDMLQNTLKTL